MTNKNIGKDLSTVPFDLLGVLGKVVIVGPKCQPPPPSFLFSEKRGETQLVVLSSDPSVIQPQLFSTRVRLD